MIDPFNVTNYEYSDAELQEFLVACICVAGKTARIMFPKVHNLLWNTSYTCDTPFESLLKMDSCLESELRKVGMGKYNILKKTLYELPQKVVSGQLDLRTCSPEDLECFAGIGMKTSRYFIVHSRKNQQKAILDRHILKFLQQKGYPDIPDTTPSAKKKYLLLEEYFLREVKLSGKSVADLDLEIWASMAKRV